MDPQAMVFLVPITAMGIAIAAIVMSGLKKVMALRLEEARVRSGVIPGGTLAELDQLRGEMDQVRQELAEVQERLDFTERLLAQRRDQERLPDGR